MVPHEGRYHGFHAGEFMRLRGRGSIRSRRRSRRDSSPDKTEKGSARFRHTLNGRTTGAVVDCPTRGSWSQPDRYHRQGYAEADLSLPLTLTVATVALASFCIYRCRDSCEPRSVDFAHEGTKNGVAGSGISSPCAPRRTRSILARPRSHRRIGITTLTLRRCPTEDWSNIVRMEGTP